MFNLIETCKYLELRPLEEDKNMTNALLWECEQEDIDEEDRVGYISHLARKSYEPYCKKRDSLCVVCESPVISQKYHGIGNFHQPFTITLANKRQITSCSDRQLPEINIDGLEPIDAFLLTHISKD